MTRKKNAPTPDTLAVVRFLIVQGPLSGEDAAEILGWSAERWWNAVSYSGELFDLTGRGWVVTDAGRAAAGPGGRPG